MVGAYLAPSPGSAHAIRVFSGKLFFAKVIASCEWVLTHNTVGISEYIKVVHINFHENNLQSKRNTPKRSSRRISAVGPGSSATHFLRQGSTEAPKVMFTGIEDDKMKKVRIHIMSIENNFCSHCSFCTIYFLVDLQLLMDRTSSPQPVSPPPSPTNGLLRQVNN